MTAFAKLDESLKRLERPDAYKVRYTAALDATLAAEMRKVPERQQ
jgi:hypothetical protein